MVAAMLNRDEEWVNEHKEEHIPGIASPRVLLQTLGTDWGRHMIDTNIWVNMVHREVNDIITLMPGQFQGIVLTDCRFNNEAEWIKAAGGDVWHISRPGAPLVTYHVSEQGVDFRLVDHSIVNDGSLEDLYLKIEEII